MTMNSHGENVSSPADDDATAEVITVRGAGDALALVQHSFGFMPEHSLVVVGLHSGRVGAHLRIDLRTGVDEPEVLARWVGEHLAGEDTHPRPDGAVIYLFTGEAPAPPAFGDPELRPFAALQEALVRTSIQDYGLDVAQSWWVGGGRIRDYDCVDPACCPYPGEDVQVAAQSALHAHMVYRGRRVLQTPGEIVDEFLGAETIPEQPEVAGVVASWGEGQHGLLDDKDCETGRITDALACWDEQISAEVLTPGARRWDAEKSRALKLMVSGLMTDDLKDAILVLAAESLPVAAAGLNTLRDVREGHGGPSGEDQDRVRRFIDVLVGRTGRRPAWERIDALARLLALMQPLMTSPGKADSLALMGWIEWARGRGTISGAYLDRCLELQPGHRLGKILNTHTSNGRICRWAMIREHSWSTGGRSG